MKKSGEKEEHSKPRRPPKTGAKGQGRGEQKLSDPQRGLTGYGFSQVFGAPVAPGGRVCRAFSEVGRQLGILTRASPSWGPRQLSQTIAAPSNWLLWLWLLPRVLNDRLPLAAW